MHSQLLTAALADKKRRMGKNLPRTEEGKKQTLRATSSAGIKNRRGLTYGRTETSGQRALNLRSSSLNWSATSCMDSTALL